MKISAQKNQQTYFKKPDDEYEPLADLIFLNADYFEWKLNVAICLDDNQSLN